MKRVLLVVVCVVVVLSLMRFNYGGETGIMWVSGLAYEEGSTTLLTLQF